jgi:hypothetical protein
MVYEVNSEKKKNLVDIVGECMVEGSNVLVVKRVITICKISKANQKARKPSRPPGLYDL